MFGTVRRRPQLCARQCCHCCTVLQWKRVIYSSEHVTSTSSLVMQSLSEGPCVVSTAVPKLCGHFESVPMAFLASVREKTLSAGFLPHVRVWPAARFPPLPGELFSEHLHLYFLTCASHIFVNRVCWVCSSVEACKSGARAEAGSGHHGCVGDTSSTVLRCALPLDGIAVR